MNCFGMIITTLLYDAIVMAIVYGIFNAIYNGKDSAKGTSIFSFAVSLISFIVLLCVPDGPEVINGDFASSTVGFVGFMSILLIFPVANAMVAQMVGDDAMQGFGQSMGVLGIPLVIVIIIMYFSDTYVPLAVLFGIGALASVYTFFAD